MACCCEKASRGHLERALVVVCFLNAHQSLGSRAWRSRPQNGPKASVCVAQFMDHILAPRSSIVYCILRMGSEERNLCCSCNEGRIWQKVVMMLISHNIIHNVAVVDH